ncbi:hypothetical protein EI94DRAFT_1769123 [Lactarius quietus]|nr:hypothetical protein EI94DRAFT_1769123 [Lactarius quietus]
MLVATQSSSRTQTIEYLRTLLSIRERCGRVHDLAKQGKLQYFEYHPEKEEDLQLLYQDHSEKTKRLIDLFLVSVLLDAGAGNDWGLGVASFNMFKEGFFSGDVHQPHQVDAKGLELITAEKTAQAMQVSSDNPMVGLEGRASLLVNLSRALKANAPFFGVEGRPGNMIDYLESESIADGPSRRLPLAALWHVLVSGLAPIWPKDRTTLGEGDELVPFHKLTGWTTYSLIEPIEKILGWRFDGLEDMTGLPEYRKVRGLLVDLGVLSLKPSTIAAEYYPSADSSIPRLPPSHPAVIEWRAMTVIELDRIADHIRAKLKLSQEQLTLAQVLESATWKGGREIAKERRPESGGPPIEIVSDGTVF